MAAAFSFSTKQLLQEMFSEMVIKKDASLISHYYHPDFLLETNGQKQDYRNRITQRPHNFMRAQTNE